MIGVTYDYAKRKRVPLGGTLFVYLKGCFD